MAYPFIFFPTWREVIERLKDDHQITFHESGKLTDPDGESASVQYFQHKTDKGIIRHVVCFDDENERLVPSVMRSLCANLGISPKFFGLTLDEPEWGDDQP